MVHLILDTNIWIYLAEGQHPFVLEGLIKKVNDNEISLLVNDEIIKEWDRNNSLSKERIKKELKKQLEFAKELKSCLKSEDEIKFNELISKIKDSNPEFEATIDSRFQLVDDLIKKQSINVPISIGNKLEIIDWALKKQAPFHRNKNSVADALILFSSIEFIKKNGINNVNYNRIDISDSVFVSYNSDDFSQGVKGNDKDLIHEDLKLLLESVGMKYERNFGNLLNLTSSMKLEIDDYMDYVESRIIEQMEWENEIKRGK